MPLTAHSYADGSEYYGEWNGDGLKHGKGRLKLLDRSIYTGYFQEGVFNGHGVLAFSDGSRHFTAYGGNEARHLVSDNMHIVCPHKHTKDTDPANTVRDIYEGEFARGKFMGSGVFARADGMKYEGQFRDGAAHGNGMLTFPAGIGGYQRSEGCFENFKLKHKEKSAAHVQKAKQEAEKARQISFLLGA